ncbi:hypothetical protein [Pseudotabrizicola alkalilacus]|uniref:Uncharacterized protein n=1 Tax=Pseudotabrizicola alkalilacus TaxID=2305252 RepID=A0A411Z7M3_9RHOB|nr:hypothetical protein [Pseudotabrizicola alkalilacus]RGP39054.1 hypothetical protein D1012_02785 [Pseudotabrizicola alkalilacus]
MWHPNQIVSLKKMLQLPPDTIHALGFISGCRAEWRLWVQLLQGRANLQIAPLVIPKQTCAHFLKSCEVLEKAAKVLRLKASEAAARRAFDESLDLLALPIGYDAHRLSRVVNLAEQLLQVFSDEILGGHLLSLDSRHAAFFDMAAPFGQSVEDSFPSAEFDISEAAKCRAVGRWTACVMHLMRVLEVGLAALARHYDVAVDSNWNKTLNEIETRTREVGKRSHGAEAEQWAAEAATHLRFIKNAWRNQAMHPRQTYDEERAVAIFESARSFMQHLSEKLSEDDLLV